MKKHFILFSTFAALLLSATLLSACGEEVQESADNGNNVETVTETTTGENCTLFSSGDDGTRTALGYDRKFYWSEGDQIYVNTDGANYKKTTSSKLYNYNRTADFVLEGVSLTAEKCSVVYIGNGTTAATATKNDLKVKIGATQTQAAWGDTAHIGRAGDCGVAEATKDGGKYTFNLRHKASYLVFQPYRPTGNANPDWKLMKIEIIADGTTLAGTYDFGTGELVGAGSSNTIEFNCGTDGFPLEDTGGAASAAKSCFVVIQPSPPGTTHELTIRYTVKVTKKPNVIYFDKNGVNNNEIEIWVIDKPIAARQYAANVVTTIKHELCFPLVSYQYYYQWDAVNPHGSSTGVGHNWVGYPTTASEIATHRATNSCKDMPNANEMYWYIVNGDPHWDTTTPWSIDGGLTEYTNGLWLKTKDVILAEGKQFSSTVGKGGYDMRLIPQYHSVSNNQAVLSVAERSKYFFLPALGFYRGGLISWTWLSYGYYWSSSPYPNIESPHAYGLNFYSSVAYVGHYYLLDYSFVAGSQWFR